MSVPLTTPPALRSPLLVPFADRLRYGFTHRPLPTGGQHLGLEEREANRRHWCEHFGLNPDGLLVPQQCHGNQFLTASQFKGEPAEADAVLLDVAGVTGLVQVADCVPILLYAPDVHQAALVHAGWRGTAQSIGVNAVLRLIESGASPEKIIGVIGPCLSQSGFEVGHEVVEALALTLPATLDRARYTTHSPRTVKPHVDLTVVNQLQLEAVGVLSIDCLTARTDVDRDLLWSHRAGDWQRQGLMAQLHH